MTTTHDTYHISGIQHVKANDIGLNVYINNLDGYFSAKIVGIGIRQINGEDHLVYLTEGDFTHFTMAKPVGRHHSGIPILGTPGFWKTPEALMSSVDLWAEIASEEKMRLILEKENGKEQADEIMTEYKTKKGFG